MEEVSAHVDSRRLLADYDVVGYRSWEDLLAACRLYVSSTRRRLTFEYILLSGLNDSLAEARELAPQIWERYESFVGTY